MIEGITVLSQHTVGDKPNIIFGIWLCFIVIILTFLTFVAIIKVKDINLDIFASILLMISIIACGLFINDYVNADSSVQYKVTIDDKVSFKEFSEKYEIIDQDREIYTIVKKEND